jgi:branched-chain amino acid aminotransferase
MFSQVLHYCQEAFEGLKAYATKDGLINLFRTDMNAKRLKKSFRRLLMAEIPEIDFINGVIEKLSNLTVILYLHMVQVHRLY